MDVKENTAGEQVFPGEVHDLPGGGVVLSKLDDIINWARSNSIWPLTFATSCCGIEMMAVASSKYDFSRFGFEVARATPRQADVIIIAGTIGNIADSLLGATLEKKQAIKNDAVNFLNTSVAAFLAFIIAKLA